MNYEFFKYQDKQNKDEYIELLEITGSLSNLFSESTDPFLYYRAMENIFCKAFNAKNLSRSDVSADASKNGIGIGLKTFLQNNGRTFQKVAEFNKDSYLFDGLSDKELVLKVSELRNERIEATKRICKLDEMMYHLVTRSKSYMAIYEEHMDLVAIDNIELTSRSKSTIHFYDGLNDYSFNTSKSTLLKRFITDENRELFGFNVDILEDPFDFLLSSKKQTSNMEILKTGENVIDYIVLPLYSGKSRRVEEKSGLNQWNAAGRKRNPNEVYIPIPKWIHRKKKDFFEYNTDDNKTEPFEVVLPNGNCLSMRVAQAGGKALMSSPNSELGKWILRDILQLKENELVTKEKLDIIGVDSVMLAKIGDGKYSLDFLKSGSYEDYEEEYGLK